MAAMRGEVEAAYEEQHDACPIDDCGVVLGQECPVQLRRKLIILEAIPRTGDTYTIVPDDAKTRGDYYEIRWAGRPDPDWPPYEDDR